MKNTKSIVIFCLVSLLLCIVGGYLFITYDATTKAQKLAKVLKEYKIEEKELITGKHLDLSKDKIKGINFNINEGKLFIDEDKEITIYQNIKIDGLVCNNIFDKPNCSIFNSKKDTLSEIQKYKTYKVGEEITLINESKWYVIHDSSEYSKYVILMSDKRIDINEDGFTVDTGSLTDPDRIPFDVSGSKKYDETKEGTVGYYLENTYRGIVSLDKILDFRLLTSEELEAIKERINFTPLTEQQQLQMMTAEDQIFESIYYFYESPRPIERLKNVVITETQDKMLKPHWLFNSYSGNFWVMEGKKAVTAVWNGDGYTAPKATTGYSLKPVMVISKENIKES